MQPALNRSGEPHRDRRWLVLAVIGIAQPGAHAARRIAQ
jgi:hypothetical protein